MPWAKAEPTGTRPPSFDRLTMRASWAMVGSAHGQWSNALMGSGEASSW
jgi:hypothetical protein